MSLTTIIKKTTLLTAAVSIFISAHSASATMIQGTLIMGGVSTTLDSAFQPTDFDSATGLFFSNAFAFLGDGDFASVLPGTPMEINPFLFAPLTPNPVTPLWRLVDDNGTLTTADDYDIFGFNLESIAIDTQNANTLSLSGTGSLYGAGFDVTPGTWNFTTQPQGAQFAGTQFFTFSAASSAVPVPEASTIITFGLGCLALMVSGYRKKQTSA